MATAPGKPVFHLMFEPKMWGEVERFRRLHHGSHSFGFEENSYLSGVEAHFHKLMLWRNLAQEHLPRLEEDRRELQERDFTNAAQSKKMAAMVEAMLAEMYSAMDCMRKVIFIIHPDATPNGAHNLGPFLKDAAKGKWHPAVPETIRQALADTAWSDHPRELRNQSVHSEPGSCHMTDGKVSYMASKTIDEAPGGRRQVVEDILGKIDGWTEQLNATTGQVFRAFNQQLKDVEIRAPCGIYNGRFYERYVVPKEATHRYAGRCRSREWFDKGDDGNKCPLRDRCTAYTGVSSQA